MDLTQYTQNLRDDLLAAASVGDDDTRRAAALLTAAMEPAARLALMNALSDLAAEVTGALDGTTVELRLDGRDVRVAVTHDDGSNSRTERGWHDDRTQGSRRESPDADGYGNDDLGRAMRDAGGELSRTTLRLFNNLKSQAEQAASAQGVSLNTYIQRAVSDSVRSSVNRPRHGHGGPHNVSGFVQG